MILQQDAFDAIDCVTPLERQEVMLKKVIDICNMKFRFEEFNEVSEFFKRIINVLKQMNYSEFRSEQFEKYEAQLVSLLQERLMEEAVATPEMK